MILWEKKNKMWIEISKELYCKIIEELKEQLTVFGSCTSMENSSLFDAKIMTEWGFKDAENPLIKSVFIPESQVDVPKNISLWNKKYYIFEK